MTQEQNSNIAPQMSRFIVSKLNNHLHDDGNKPVIIREQASLPVPPLLKALRENNRSLPDFIHGSAYCELLAWLGYRHHLGTLVHIDASIVSTVTPEDTYNHVNDFVTQSSDIIIDAKNVLFKGLKRINKDLTTLPPLQGDFLRDDRYTAWLPFQNGVLKITRDKMELLDYDEVEGFIWKHKIIPGDYLAGLDFATHDFWRFLCLTCTNPINKAFEADRFEALLCAIGYNTHSHKDPSQTAITIFSDVAEDAQDNNGRTGKGRIVEAIRHMRRDICLENGRNLDPDNRFNFSRITPSTDILWVDDLDTKHFPVPKFYSLATENPVLESKGKEAREIPWEQAPKFIITTNMSAWIGTDSSDLGRRMDAQLQPYFNHQRRPIDVFKRLFFKDWSRHDWSGFYAIMAHAVQRSLFHDVARNGLPSYRNTAIEDSLKRQIGEKLIDFLDAEIQPQNAAGKTIILLKKDLRDKYDSSCNECLSAQDFNKRMLKYCKLRLSESHDTPRALTKNVKGKATEVYELAPLQVSSAKPASAAPTAARTKQANSPKRKTIRKLVKNPTSSVKTNEKKDDTTQEIS